MYMCICMCICIYTSKRLGLDFHTGTGFGFDPGYWDGTFKLFVTEVHSVQCALRH